MNGLVPRYIDKQLKDLSQQCIDIIDWTIGFNENADIPINILNKKYILEIIVEGVEPEVDLGLFTIPEYREQYREDVVKNLEFHYHLVTTLEDSVL